MFKEDDLDEIVRQIQPRLREGESIDDVIEGGAFLASQRAERAGRTPTRDDLTYALSIFTWWPIKPTPSQEVENVLLQLRPRLFEGAASRLAKGDRMEDLMAVVPEDTLLLDDADLHRRQREQVGSFLRVVTSEQ